MSGFLLRSERSLATASFGEIARLCDPQTAATRHLTIIEAHLEPGGGHSFHHHVDQEELIYVLDGRIEQWLGRECRILGPGDAVVIACGAVHASFNAGDVPARVLAILGPSVGDSGYACVDVFDQAPWNTLREVADAKA